MTRRGWLLFVALGIIWGLPYLLIRVSVREISPELLVFIRTGGAALILVPIAAARGEFGPALQRWRPILLYSAVELAVPWLLLFSAEQRLSSSVSGLLIATVPLFAAMLAWASRSERVDARRLVGLGVGIAGVAAIVGFDVRSSGLLDVFALFVTAFGYALGPWVFARYLAGVPPLGAVALSFAFCAVAYSPSAAVSLPRRALGASIVESIVTLTLVCTIGAFLIFPALIAEIGAMRATLVTYVNPAIAVLLGVIALNEHFGVATGIGFALILGGCVLASRPVREGKAMAPPAVSEP
ncbi:MAG: DMT family transporter [Actinomycetota bacterium]|nr:DMT family transporter [Actinomycetota bacterium]